MGTQKYASRPVGTLQPRPRRSWRRGVALDRARRTVSWTGQICPILLTDISGFSTRGRSDDDRLTLRRVMYDLLQQAFGAAGLRWREFHTEDRGDGALIVIPPDTPASPVVSYVLSRLASALRQHNQSASDALRMQLRLALHAGPVIRDAQGMTGHAINQTARLVQASTLRKHLKETRADLGVIVSGYIYDNVIRQHGGQPAGAADYQKIRFRAKESALTAWIYLAGGAASQLGLAGRAHLSQRRGLDAGHELDLAGGLVQEQVETADDDGAGLAGRLGQRSGPGGVYHVEHGGGTEAGIS